MTKINEIMQPLSPGQIQKNSGVASPLKKTEKTEEFSDTIKNFLVAVNNSKKEASAKVSDVVQGKTDNLVEAMTKVEESKLNFQLMLEIRNKLLESYQELQRMQV